MEYSVNAWELKVYKTDSGREPFVTWYNDLKGNARAYDAVTRRLRRIEQGNLGDCKRVGNIKYGPGVLELRIDVGPGYRIYCARLDRTVVLLLGGGTKRRQSADIRQAQQRLQDHDERQRSKVK